MFHDNSLSMKESITMGRLQEIMQNEYDNHLVNYLEKNFGISFLARALAIVDLSKALKIEIKESSRIKRRH